jgi:hypothetical protein
MLRKPRSKSWNFRLRSGIQEQKLELSLTLWNQEQKLELSLTLWESDPNALTSSWCRSDELARGSQILLGQPENYVMVGFAPAVRMTYAGEESPTAFLELPRLAESVNYPCFSKVVRRHLKLDPISRGKTDESLPHFSRDVGEDEMLISKLNAEHGSREHSDDLSFGYNRTFHGHSKLEAFV